MLESTDWPVIDVGALISSPHSNLGNVEDGQAVCSLERR